MNVRELKLELEGLDDNVEVRIAQQPHWPFEYDIDLIVATEPNAGLFIQPDPEGEGEFVVWNESDEEAVAGPMSSEECERWLRDREAEHQPIVYIGEGRQLGYLPSEARRALSW